MAMQLPQHVSINRASTSSYTVEKLFDRINSAIESKYHSSAATIPAVYPNYADKLKQERTAVIAKLKANLDEVVAKAHANGYNLLAHATLLNLSESKILEILALDESATPPRDWVNSHFDSTIEALNNYLKTITAQIPDEVSKIKTTINTELNKELSKYALDASSIPPNSPLANILPTIIDQIVNNYLAFDGTPFDPSEPAFADKTSFDVNAQITAEMSKPEFVSAIIPTVKVQMTNEILALSFRPGTSVRDLRSHIYNQQVHGTLLTAHDIDHSYMSGFEALINKYTAGGKITIDEIGLTDRVQTSVQHVLMTVYVKASISSTSFEVFSRAHEMQIQLSHIEEMNQRVRNMLHAGSMLPRFKEEAMWTEGQVLSKDDILNNYIPFEGSPDIAAIMTYVEQYTTAYPNTEFKFTFQGGSLHVEFIDNGISSSDFDYGDKTDLTTPELMKFWFNRHNSVDQAPIYTNHQSNILFKPSHVFSVSRAIKFVGKMEELQNLLRDATKSDKQNTNLPIEDLLNPDGTFKTADRALLKKIFPNIDTDFFNAMDAATAYSVSFKVQDVNHDAIGVSTIRATFTSPTMATSDVDISFRTVNKDKIIDDARQALNKYENTWEDKTPSSLPDGFSPTLGTPQDQYFPGTKPTMDSLKSIFQDIDNYFINYDKPDGTQEALLKILASTTETKDSTLTFDMLESWNYKLIEILGGLNDESRELINLGLQAAQTLGLSRSSKYSYANIEMQAGTPHTYKMISVHYMSHEQRWVENELIGAAVAVYANKYLDKLFKDHEVSESVRKAILDKFQQQAAPILQQISDVLKPNDPTAEVPDFEMHTVNGYMTKLADAIKSLKDEYHLNEGDLDKLKTASKVFKYILTTVGGLMGLSALLALIIPIRVALGDRKFRKENPKVKRSSKKIIIVSAISGLLAAGSSVAIMIYVFITQGGF